MLARTPEDIGNLVREQRLLLGLTQRQLADQAGVSRPWLVSVEKGHPRAELGKLLMLFAELELQIDLFASRAVIAGDPPSLNLAALFERHDAGGSGL